MLLEKGKAILFESCGLDPSSLVVAGVSGGADSVAMLDILVKTGLNVCVAHLNHQLRPSASSEAQFVQKITRDYGLEFVTRVSDVKRRVDQLGESVEEAARNERYQFLFETAEAKDAQAVLVAHQADDQVETILLNLLRGTGLNGLTAMQLCSISAYHPDIPLVRPLLECWRDEIMAYCAEEKLVYVTDESNADAAYRRNRIRLQLIPILQDYNPKIKHTLQRMGKLLEADKEFIDGYLKEVAAKCCLTSTDSTAEVDIQIFQKEPEAIQRYMVKWVLNQCFPDEKELGFIQIEDARKMLAREIESTNLHLNDHVIIRIERGRGVFLRTREAEMPSDNWPSITEPIEIETRQREVSLGDYWKLSLELLLAETVGETYLDNTDPYQAYLDADHLEDTLQIRSWQPGDRFQPLGMGGKSIKLSDFWINKKIHQRAKKFWPLVISDGELVWIPGFQPAQDASITDKTRQILYLKVTKSQDSSSD